MNTLGKPTDEKLSGYFCEMGSVGFNRPLNYQLDKQLYRNSNSKVYWEVYSHLCWGLQHNLHRRIQEATFYEK